jgi:hypothetical protein
MTLCFFSYNREGGSHSVLMVELLVGANATTSISASLDIFFNKEKSVCYVCSFCPRGLNFISVKEYSSTPHIYTMSPTHHTT